jgi:hypothetical protein
MAELLATRPEELQRHRVEELHKAQLLADVDRLLG